LTTAQFSHFFLVGDIFEAQANAGSRLVDGFNLRFRHPFAVAPFELKKKSSETKTTKLVLSRGALPLLLIGRLKNNFC
jgi:hypothetical protein